MRTETEIALDNLRTRLRLLAGEWMARDADSFGGSPAGWTEPATELLDILNA